MRGDQWKPEIIDIEESKEAISFLKNGRIPGPEGVKADLIKIGINKLFQIMIFSFYPRRTNTTKLSKKSGSHLSMKKEVRKTAITIGAQQLRVYLPDYIEEF